MTLYDQFKDYYMKKGKWQFMVTIVMVRLGISALT